MKDEFLKKIIKIYEQTRTDLVAGRVQVFKKLHEKNKIGTGGMLYFKEPLVMVDVVSLYPSVMLKMGLRYPTGKLIFGTIDEFREYKK